MIFYWLLPKGNCRGPIGETAAMSKGFNLKKNKKTEKMRNNKLPKRAMPALNKERLFFHF